MKWMKERDLLIAQTMAFVQSVTGKPPVAEMAVAAPVTAPATKVETSVSVPASLPVATLPDVAPRQMEALPAAYVPPVVAAPAVEKPSPVLREAPAALARPDLRVDFQSEIRARVANFRAHQERFSREREAYCTATMAKVHATLKENELPPPRPGK